MRGRRALIVRRRARNRAPERAPRDRIAAALPRRKNTYLRVVRRVHAREPGMVNRSRAAGGTRGLRRTDLQTSVFARRLRSTRGTFCRPLVLDARGALLRAPLDSITHSCPYEQKVVVYQAASIRAHSRAVRASARPHAPHTDRSTCSTSSDTIGRRVTRSTGSSVLTSLGIISDLATSLASQPPTQD